MKWRGVTIEWGKGPAFGRWVAPGRLEARTVGGARNGFPFLPLHGCWSVSDWYGRALRTSAHRPIALTMLGDLCVAVLQVDEVGGFSGREIVDFRSASRAEMQGWPAVDGLLSASVCSAEPARILGRGLDGSSGRGSPLTGRKVRLSIGEWCLAGARASCGCWRRVGWAAPCVPAGSRQAVENVGLGLLWGWAKPGCVGVAGVALARALVGSAACCRLIAILNT